LFRILYSFLNPTIHSRVVSGWVFYQSNSQRTQITRVFLVTVSLWMLTLEVVRTQVVIQHPHRH